MAITSPQQFRPWGPFLAEDSCGNGDNTARESGSANLYRAVQSQMLDAGASNNAVVHTRMSFSRYKQMIIRASAKGKGLYP